MKVITESGATVDVNLRALPTNEWPSDVFRYLTPHVMRKAKYELFPLDFIIDHIDRKSELAANFSADVLL